MEGATVSIQSRIINRGLLFTIKNVNNLTLEEKEKENRVIYSLMENETFSSSSSLWEDWVEVFADRKLIH